MLEEPSPIVYLSRASRLFLGPSRDEKAGGKKFLCLLDDEKLDELFFKYVD